jgi:hypothetical protein
VYLDILEKIQQILNSVSPLILFVIVLLLGMYVFWSGSMETRKNISSVYDIFVTSLLGGLVVGRICYIIINWEQFSSFIWYWLPYEKYGEEIYLFRLLPWRFMRIWDWRIDILSMFVAFILIASFWVLIVKKWKWSHMFTTIFFTAEGMLAISFILLGASTANQEWLTQGIVMVLLPLVLFFLKNSVKKAIVGKKEIKTLMLLDIFFITLTTAYVTYTYFIADINNTEKASIITFAVWSLLGIIFYMKETKQADITIEKVSSVRTVSHLDINQPIKLPK